MDKNKTEELLVKYDIKSYSERKRTFLGIKLPKFFGIIYIMTFAYLILESKFKTNLEDFYTEEMDIVLEHELSMVLRKKYWLQICAGKDFDAYVVTLVDPKTEKVLASEKGNSLLDILSALVYTYGQ